MKKFILLIIALFYTVVAYAQGTDQVSAILQHGDTETIFIGNTGFAQAYEAAVDGDVIILSQGIFNTINNISTVLRIMQKQTLPQQPLMALLDWVTEVILNSMVFTLKV